jgi:hypothetical protein
LYRSISIIPKQNCAFVTFTTRTAAEAAADGTFNKLVIKQQRLKILWGKSQGQTTPAAGDIAGSSKFAPVTGLRECHFCYFKLMFKYKGCTRAPIMLVCIPMISLCLMLWQ